jgi:hypothetical protein
VETVGQQRQASRYHTTDNLNEQVTASQYKNQFEQLKMSGGCFRMLIMGMIMVGMMMMVVVMGHNL